MPTQAKQLPLLHCLSSRMIKKNWGQISSCIWKFRRVRVQCQILGRLKSFLIQEEMSRNEEAVSHLHQIPFQISQCFNSVIFISPGSNIRETKRATIAHQIIWWNGITCDKNKKRFFSPFRRVLKWSLGMCLNPSSTSESSVLDCELCKVWGPCKRPLLSKSFLYCRKKENKGGRNAER
jgi:hypothetical protein